MRTRRESRAARLSTIRPRVLGGLIGAVAVTGLAAAGIAHAASTTTPFAPASVSTPGAAASPSTPAPAPATTRLPAVPHPAATRTASPAPTASKPASGTTWGVDVSFPQCGPGGLLSVGAAFAVVGVNNGRPFTTNSCLADEIAYARHYSGMAVYLNTEAPPSGDATAYGAKLAADGLARARAAGLRPQSVWLDVETLNHWSTPAVNAAVVQGALAELARLHVAAGVYSTPLMWLRLTGGAPLSVPTWVATTGVDWRGVGAYCVTGFGGRAATFAQYVAGAQGRAIDVDVVCPGQVPVASRLLVH